MPVADGCTVKTTRNGIGYAEPTVETLEKLVALRVHFDDVDAEGGALGVVAGSHRRGVLRVAAIRDIPLSEYRPCIAERGDVLVMRPLILHRSGRHLGDAHRRVLHVVYATEQPPEPLRWREFG
jgi:ectoine hydroxylase-related dioxygenase (phytanoyl-CoA dioxygenase family)